MESGERGGANLYFGVDDNAHRSLKIKISSQFDTNSVIVFIKFELIFENRMVYNMSRKGDKGRTQDGCAAY